MKANLLLALSFLVVVLLVLLAAELIVRLAFPSINFQGTDHRLIRERMFGKTFGWNPDATGTVFGREVSIGHDGFRIHGGPAESDTTIFLMGDSVIFGVGVEAESTFAGILQQSRPMMRVVNTGCVGYGVAHYRDVLRSLTASDHTVRQVFIFYSLNDLYPVQSLGVEFNPFFRFFRTSSKLYLLLKNLLFDRSKTYFDYDFSYYRNDAPEFANAMETLISTVKETETRGIPCTVVLLPYEYQLRTGSDSLLLPQKVIKTSLEERGVHVLDMFPRFAGAAGSSRDYYLYGDHMHLSNHGHRVVARALQGSQFMTYRPVSSGG